ncbi:hypothetical protein L1D44_20980 [Shewanella sp. Isolate13]|uniref:hypothetical protein n=1 Tax=Shewanella sp. Isolate13 TaxID=2908531 RepID=UPI001EFDE799|nr:hypothetical protein [Shewanella sp. Isolate13]MCG9732258.1 hypothetical protein [Shewanella sp. Isolate13]
MTLVKAKQELIERQEYQVFFQDFESNLTKLTQALKTTKDVQKLANQINDKGFWSNAFGSISGRNDKDLAAMVENLGASLEVTQNILTIVLKVQNIKNGFLKEFHEALVEKIVKLSKDDRTLDSNQKEAALAIVSKIEQQVSYQLAQSQQIENHERKLMELDDFVEVKDILDSEQSAKIAHLDKTSQQIIQGADNRQKLINELQQKSEAKRKKDLAQDEDISQLSKMAQSLQDELKQKSEAKKLKDASQDSAIEMLNQQKVELKLQHQQTSLQLQAQAEEIDALKQTVQTLSEQSQRNEQQANKLAAKLEQTASHLNQAQQQHIDYVAFQGKLSQRLVRNLLPIVATIASTIALYLGLQPL